jgi:predicted ATPase
MDVRSRGSVPKEPPVAGKHNLPATRTSFVGREREMLEVKQELAMTRLLTLTGAGGSGKTRLALEVARDLAGAYPDGVWLVELAPLSEPDLVAQEVAGALKIAERPGQPLTDTLLDALADKEMLLIMDNCEHLVEAAAQLVDVLLDSCPHLRVLATSREPLGVSGEVNRPVPPLSLPGSADEVPTLTRREEEIATLVTQGMTNRQIATELVISEHTAATHIRRILKKLGLQSRAQIGSWLTEQRDSSRI